MAPRSSHCIMLDSSIDAGNMSSSMIDLPSCNPMCSKQKSSICDNSSLHRTSSIGLGITNSTDHKQQQKHSNGCIKPPSKITLPPPPTIRFDSGTPKDTATTTIFPFERRILPLPSPSSIDSQQAFTTHGILSPFIPATDTSLPICSDTDTCIPVISLSPSSSPQHMPSLSEFPFLGDIGDDLPNNTGSLAVPPSIDSEAVTAGMMREQQSLLSPAIQTFDETTLTGKTIWKFRINRLLGVGAFSKVYLATDEKHGQRKSAIKMIGKAKMLKDLRMQSSVEREVAVLQFLRHPGVIQLEATMEIERHLCLVLEYIDGGELFDFVQHQGTMDSTGKVIEDLVKDLFLQLIETVHWIHEKNVVHRDLKLENILLYRNDNGQLKLKVSDFGLARLIDPQQPLLSTRCGSEEYAAPEIWQGIGYDGRLTDTWACGVILYAMLVGYLPFTARDGNSLSQLFYQIIQATVRWPKDQMISCHAKQVVASLLVRQPEKRMSLVDIPRLPWFHSDNLPIV